MLSERLVPPKVVSAIFIVSFSVFLSQVNCGKANPPGSFIKPTVALSFSPIWSISSKALAFPVLKAVIP